MKVENPLAGLKATSESARLFTQAQEVIASGVNSTPRYCHTAAMAVRA